MSKDYRNIRLSSRNGLIRVDIVEFDEIERDRNPDGTMVGRRTLGDRFGLMPLFKYREFENVQPNP